MLTAQFGKVVTIRLFALFGGMLERMSGSGPIRTVGLKHVLEVKHLLKCSAEQKWGGLQNHKLFLLSIFPTLKTQIFSTFHCFIRTSIAASVF